MLEFVVGVGVVLAIVVVTIVLCELVFHPGWVWRRKRKPKLPAADTRSVKWDPARGDVVFWAGTFYMFGTEELPNIYRVWHTDKVPGPKTEWFLHELMQMRRWHNLVDDGQLVARAGLTIEAEKFPDAPAVTEAERDRQRAQVAYQYKPPAKPPADDADGRR